MAANGSNSNGRNGTKSHPRKPETTNNSGSTTDEAPVAKVQLPLFEMSSQFKNWRYSAESLAKARHDLNDTAVSRVRSMLQEELETDQGPEAPQQPAPSEVQYLTVADELSLVAYYLSQLTRLCKAFKFPTNVESTAMTYLKRFYLRNTCMDYHPKNVMLTCLFLSTKTENHTITIDNFTSKIPKCSNADVLNLEFLVAQSLKFQFKAHHADLAGRGMMLDMQTLPDLSDADLNHLLDTVYPKAAATILLLRLTDAEFLYTPSQIALAAFHLADPSMTERWLSAKLALASASTLRKDQASPVPAAEETIRDVVDPIVDLVEKGKKAVDVEMVREVDKRLRYCKNPEKDPESSLFRKRQAQEEEEQQRKKAKKEADRPMDLDPFA